MATQAPRNTGRTRPDKPAFRCPALVFAGESRHASGMIFGRDLPLGAALTRPGGRTLTQTEPGAGTTRAFPQTTLSHRSDRFLLAAPGCGILRRWGTSRENTQFLLAIPAESVHKGTWRSVGLIGRRRIEREQPSRGEGSRAFVPTRRASQKMMCFMSRSPHRDLLRGDVAGASHLERRRAIRGNPETRLRPFADPGMIELRVSQTVSKQIELNASASGQPTRVVFFDARPLPHREMRRGLHMIRGAIGLHQPWHGASPCRSEENF